jgi:hypothetical protein
MRWPSGHSNQFGSDKQLEKSRHESSSPDAPSRSRRPATGCVRAPSRVLVDGHEPHRLAARSRACMGTAHRDSHGRDSEEEKKTEVECDRH